MSSTTTPAQTAKIFSTADFHFAVHRVFAAVQNRAAQDHPAHNHPAPRVAIFDCDGTLWSGDAGSGFMHWTIEQGLLSPQAVAWIDQRYRGYLAGQVSELAICGEMVQVYRGLPDSTLRAAAARYFSTHVEPNIFPEMLTLIRDLQSAGVEIWAVSSTNDWVVEEGVRRFNIPPQRVLSARVAVDPASGLITDTLLDVPTDQGKVAALARVGITAPHAVFGNSVHDAHMLAIARANGAFPVNPTLALLQRAALERWPVFYPASVAPSP